jgi:hypothetical protein
VALDRVYHRVRKETAQKGDDPVFMHIIHATGTGCLSQLVQQMA